MVLLQDRDKRLLQLCYEHQFITLDHAQFEYPGDGERNARRRLSALEEEGYLIKQDGQVGARRHLYRLTQTGQAIARQLSPWDVGQYQTLNLKELVHDAFVASARQRLARLWPAARFQPEGAIKDSLLGAEPDGIFIFPSGKWIAIEVENSDKGPARFTLLTKRWLAVSQLLFVLYISTTSELEQLLRRYLSEGKVEQPMGVVSWEGLQQQSAVWSLRGDLPLFQRTEF